MLRRLTRVLTARFLANFIDWIRGVSVDVSVALDREFLCGTIGMAQPCSAPARFVRDAGGRGGDIQGHPG